MEQQENQLQVHINPRRNGVAGDLSHRGGAQTNRSRQVQPRGEYSVCSGLAFLETLTVR